MTGSVATMSFPEAVSQMALGSAPEPLAKQIVAAMTVEEKLGCLDGDTEFWSGMTDMTSGGYHEHPWPAAQVERLGVPGIQFVDGPRGSVVGPATCFPVSMARGATFDPDLEERIGAAIGAEIRAIGGTFTGAVCLNLLRHPAWGRAQETYGEEPMHVGEMAAALTRGLQRHVLACMKHFALNSMENARFTVDVTADDRALHEVYLPHFRRVAEEGVASVMSAYNSVNGTWCGDSRTLLTDVLREEWGWEGFVITDFMFGLRDPVGSVRAGCDIEMPFRQQRDAVLAAAVADGRLDIADVDRSVTRIVATLLRFAHVFTAQPDRSILAAPAHRQLARQAAVAGTVLLRNEGVLPLDGSQLTSIAVLGPLAARANLGDGGSSDVHPPNVVTLLDGLRSALPDVEVRHADGDVGVARTADVTVVVVGYTKHEEGEYIDENAVTELFQLFPARPDARSDVEPVGPTEDDSAAAAGFASGGDRRTLRLDESQERLIADAVAAARGPVIVCTMGGSAIVMPWLETVDAALHVWYPGMMGGEAVAAMLLGNEEPGGRLPFAVPHDEADLVDFDPDARAVTYDLFHGHWYLERSGIAPHLPYGHGLGYTTFDLEEPVLEGDVATLLVRNVGDRPGSSVVFAFAGLPGSQHERPVRRLIGFARVYLEAGESRSLAVALDWSHLDLRLDGRWFTEPGTYRVELGQSAADLPVVVEVVR